MKTKIDEADKAATKALSFLIKQRIKNPSFVRTMAVRMSKRLGRILSASNWRHGFTPSWKSACARRWASACCSLPKGPRRWM
jgi:hypothetical protein